jgi:hypothetical protein
MSEMLTFKKLIDAWMEAANSNSHEVLKPFISENFIWVSNNKMTMQGLMDWCDTTEAFDAEYESTIFDSEDIIIGTHFIRPGNPEHLKGRKSRVMGVAKVKDGKVYEYFHNIMPLE